MTTGLINFVANGTVTVNTQSNITSVGTLSQLTVSGTSNLGAVGNVRITGGAANYVLTTNGSGNLSWVAGGNIGGTGTVTNVNTSGSGLGFTLTGGPITTTGTVALTVPNATSLRSNLTIGNVANLNLNGNSSTFIDGTGNFTVPPGTYSNSNVASYLPTYTGNISANNVTITNLLVSNVANIVTLNATGNISANNANISNVLNANVGNFTGNIRSLNANLGNLATSNYFQGDGSLLTNLPIPNYANFAGNLINGNTSVRLAANGNVTVNVAGVSNIAIFSNTGVNVSGTLNATGNLTVANANLGTLAIANSYVGIMATANQYLISQLGTLTSLDVTGNVAANYYTGNGSLLTGVTAVNANYANYASNVITSSQPNITSLGSLTGLNVSGNASFTGSNVSLGPVNNVHITGGTNGYVLQTDGAGNISWVNGTTTGNGVVGGANRQIQYNNQGNFAGNVGFEFNSTTSNVTVPSFINSTSQNGNAYLTGWTNAANMGVPSLFVGIYSTITNGLAGTTVSLGNQIPTVAIANGNTAANVFGSNTFPKPGQPYFSIGSPTFRVPLVRNTGGNGNLIFSNVSSSNTIGNFANIGAGGIDAVVAYSAAYTSNQTTVPGNVTFFSNNETRIYSTDSTSSQIYLSSGTETFANTNTTTIPFAGNYKVTSAGVPFIYTTSPNIFNSCDIVVLNQNNFTAPSKWAVIDTVSLTLVNSGNIGNSNSYVNLKSVIGYDGGQQRYATYTANTGNSLGKYAILNLASNANITFSEYPLPTVTPNATNSFCFCLINTGSSASPYYIMTCKDSDVANNISNTYTAVTSNLYANSWTTYISANTPTWFDKISPITSANLLYPNRIIGIQNPGNGSNSTYVTSINNGQSWSSIGTGNVALAYLKISNVSTTANSSSPPFTDTYTLTTSAIAPDSEIGIQSPSNVNANLFTNNANIVFTYPKWIYIDGTYLKTGDYKNLGTLAIGASSNGSLWVKEA